MRRILSLLLISALSACAADEAIDDGGGDTDFVTADGKADGDLRARVTGMTVWMDPQVRRELRDGTPVWTMRGTASRSLDSVFSFVPDDPFGEATLTSATRFEAMLNEGHELNTMLSGLPLFVRLVPPGEDGVFAGLWLRAALSGFSGSSAIWVDGALAPVWVGGQVIYRARVTTSSGWNQLVVLAAAAARPTVTSEGTRTWRVDFTYQQLSALAADPAGLTFEARRPGSTARKRASASARIGWLGLTRRDPYEVWTTECEDEVRACLDDLGIGDLDAEDCGSYREVARCGGAAVAPEPAAADVAAAIRAQLVAHYEWNGDAIAAAGGRTLAEAQALVTASGVARVTDPAADPLSHDLAWTFVYRSPDPTVPGSDAWFYALYERRGGTLETVYYHDLTP